MKRKFVCRLLSFSMAFLMLPQTVMAAESYDETDGSTGVTGYEAEADSADTTETEEADTNTGSGNTAESYADAYSETTADGSADTNAETEANSAAADSETSEEGAAEEYGADTDTSDIEAASVLSYDEGIAKLYDESMSITDGEILSTAQSMVSDLSALENALSGREDAQDILGVVKQFEVEKAEYLQGGQTSISYNQSVLSELDKQHGYMNDYVVPASEVVEIIPRIDVLSADAGDSQVTAAIAEWNTVGYTEGSGESASAYEYDYTLTLSKDTESGTWSVSSVSDTDQNFDWIYNSEELEDEITTDQDTSVYEDDLEAYSGVAEYGVSTISGISYDPSKAVAYADKWWNGSNSAFPSYVRSGVDCANFVSQCLNAGGIERTSSFAPSKSAWINCIYQIKYLTSIGGKLIEKCSASDVKTGNPVYYDWDGGAAKTGRYPFAKGVMKYDYDHVGICVGYNTSGTPVVDAHTTARYHVKYDLNARTVSTIQLVTDDSPDTAETAAAKKANSPDSSKAASFTGFKKTDGKTYYYRNDKAQTGWQYIDKKWYYFNGQGVMQTGWQELSWSGGKSKFYFDGNGVMKTGWQYLNKKWYYFNSNGAMLTGWQQLSWSGGKSKFYFDSNGVMKTGWQYLNKKWYYFNGNGAMQTGWQYLSWSGGKNWFYFDSNGAMKTGWLYVGGAWYYLGRNGEMLTGWQELKWSGGKSWFHFAGNGKMSVNTTVDGYKVDKNGARVSSSSGSSSSKKNGWVKSGSYWYYYSNGTLQRGWQYIDKNWYYFNGSGAMQTGWMYLSWSGGKSWFYAGSDGKLVKGWQKLKWSGGTNWFYFDKNCAMAANTTVDGHKVDANGVRK